jgi:Rrf2 family nitric oxide-sensitive transcriptional repressor
MQLTRFTDYSLRVLIYLGVRQGEWVTIGQISEAHGISRNHLMKVVSFLSRSGYVDSQRGPGGGVRLLMQPNEIRVAAVVRAAESDMNLAECFGSNPSCRIAPACRLRGIFAEGLEAFMGVLDQYSLDDLIQPRQSLRQALGF